jgi:signal transduction histidine kinase
MKNGTPATDGVVLSLWAKMRAAAVHLVYERTIALLTVMFCGGVIVTLWHMSYLSSALVESGALQGTALYSATLTELRTFYNSQVVERVRPRGVEVTHDYVVKDGAIPIPATFSIEFGKHIGQKIRGMEIRLYSDFPFPFRKDGGARDSFEREALTRLRSEPGKPFVQFEDFQGRPSLRYATAVRMQAGCVACHNTHPESPKKDWKVGDVRGVQEIIRPLDSAAAETRAGLQNTFFLLGSMGLLGLSGLGLVIGRMRKTSVELEQRVAERTAQLESTNKELEAFSYSVSHDLAAPLRSIDGFSQALLEDYEEALDANGKDYLRRVRGATQHMGQLIDDLLNLSRVSRKEMQRERVDLSGLARDIAAELKRSDGARQVNFAIGDEFSAVGDSGLLRIALANLLGNAWKFTGNKPRATIEFGAMLDNGKPTFFVRDDGAGFDMAYASKMFAPFQRLHATTEFDGTGIGLATVQRIIYRHGGRVWAEGEVERGATFYFTL